LRSTLAQLEEETHDLEDAREIMMYLRHKRDTLSLSLQAAQQAGVEAIFVRFAGRIATTIVRAVFRTTMSGICLGGTPRNIPTRLAETFAVWLTPRSNWRKRYRGCCDGEAAILDRLARKLAKADPTRRRGIADITVDDMETTLAEFYHQTDARSRGYGTHSRIPICAICFPGRSAEDALAASEFLHSHRKADSSTKLRSGTERASADKALD